MFACIIALIIVFLWMQKPVMLENLAYDAHPRYGYTVYLEEGKSYEPYYVLTNRYNGQKGTTLLLRKYLLDEPREYESYILSACDHAYYENSSIDKFLNSEFYETLSPAVQKNILDTTIAIADRSTLASTKKLTIGISRKVFLLAISEVEGYDEIGVMQNEGAWLRYFKKTPSEEHIAHFETGRPEAWWTRSASMWGSTSVWVMAYDGWSASGVQTGYLLGVRPAFCLPGELPVELRAGIKDGESVYVIDWPEGQIAQ